MCCSCHDHNHFSTDRKVLVTATIDGALEFFDLNIAALPNAIKPRSPKKPEPVIVARKQSKRGKVVVQDVTEDDDDDDASGPTCGHTPLAPVATLYDPRAKRHHVRSVDISDDFKFVVAVGHGDLTCIWAAAEDKVAQ